MNTQLLLEGFARLHQCTHSSLPSNPPTLNTEAKCAGACTMKSRRGGKEIAVNTSSSWFSEYLFWVGFRNVFGYLNVLSSWHARLGLVVLKCEVSKSKRTVNMCGCILNWHSNYPWRYSFANLPLAKVLIVVKVHKHIWTIGVLCYSLII